jgi:uncharacterized protein YgfB (UPF0149 family)
VANCTGILTSPSLFPEPAVTEPLRPDFAELERHLQGLAIGPAELHGSLCGYLCGGGVPQPGRWLDQLCIDPEGLADGASADLESLRRSTIALLDDPDLSFSPLLPDPDSAMSGRVQALAQWCGGFLGGFGLSGAGEHAPGSEEAGDAMRDIERIAQFGYEAGDEEEDETAFAEILEYVRMAVILLRQEGAPAPAPADATRH